MKKILALVLALMMALSCTGALAEASRIEMPETQTETETAIEIHADLGEGRFTTTASLALDTDTVLALVNMMGLVSEEKLPVITSVVNILNNASGKLGMFENGAQLDVQLQGTPVITLAGSAVEDGSALVVGSDLIPNYLLVVSQELIQQLVGQVQEQLQGSMGQSAGAAASIDPEALMNAVLPHLMAFVSAIQEKIGEAEMGEYTFEDTAFQVKVPLNVTVKELAAMIGDLIHGVLAEEAVAGLAETLSSVTGSPVDLNGALESVDAALNDIQETPDEECPVLDIALYQSMEGDIYINADLSREEQAINACGGKVGGKVYAHLNVFDELKVDASAGMEEGLIAAELKVNFQGMFVGIEAKLAGLQNVTVGLYFMNPMAPVAVITVETVPGAENTFALDSEGKTVVTLEQLMNDDTGAAASGLLSDVMYYGLSGLMAKAAQLMPEDVTALMSLLSGAE